jgi:SAM-dependent methyltransferase
MPIRTIEFKGQKYPGFQADGQASQFAIPAALNVLYGNGIDIGCNRPEWAYPHASFLVDPALDIPEFSGYDAMKLPKSPYNIDGKWDYLFSSHLLEHLNDFVAVLEYWHANIKRGGTLFLYLPDCNAQNYWRPWHNRKHVNYFTPEIFKQYFADMSDMWDISFVSGTDINCSFIAYARKKV